MDDEDTLTGEERLEHWLSAAACPAQFDLGQADELRLDPASLAGEHGLAIDCPSAMLGRLSTFLEAVLPHVPAGAPVVVRPGDLDSYDRLKFGVALDRFGLATVLCGADPDGRLCFATRHLPHAGRDRPGAWETDDWRTTFSYEGAPVCFHYPRGDDIQRRPPLYLNTFYEAGLLEAVRALDPSVVVDVGANIGNHAVYFAKIIGARVHAFEPNPAAYVLLRKNLVENGVEGRVRALACALGARAGRGRVIPGDADNLGSARVEASLSSDGDTEIVTLDECLRDEPGPVDVLKIDVEGMETDVLAGAHETLSRWHPHLFAEALDEAAARALADALSPYGYRRIGDHGGGLTLEFAAKA